MHFLTDARDVVLDQLLADIRDFEQVSTDIRYLKGLYIRFLL